MIMRNVQSTTRNLILAVVLLSLSGLASATHYSFDGRCYETASDAVIAFGNSFPRIYERHILFAYSVQLQGENQISYRLNIHNFATNNITSPNTQVVILFPCPVVTPDITPLDYTAAGAIFAFFFSSVVALWFFSKNIGLILDAIKKY